MADLPKIADVDKESRYGYVFGVSGPGKPLLGDQTGRGVVAGAELGPFQCVLSPWTDCSIR